MDNRRAGDFSFAGNWIDLGIFARMARCANESRGCFAKRMKFHKPILLLAEIRESLSMAFSAIAAHKLRSVLTLLGVLIGVFSIIVVMTAMRVLRNFVESQLSRMGGQTFMVRKMPVILFDSPDGGFEKFRRRKNI